MLSPEGGLAPAGLRESTQISLDPLIFTPAARSGGKPPFRTEHCLDRSVMI